MMPRSILRGLGALVVMGAVVAFLYLRFSTGSYTPAVGTPANVPQAPPAAAPVVQRSPDRDAVQLPVARCVPAPGHPDSIDIREDPSATSQVVARAAGKDPDLARLDARSVKGDGDWIRVRYDDRVGWSNGAAVICRFAPAQAAQVIAGEAESVLSALKGRNMSELSTHVHPIKGLRFSPLVDIDVKRSVVLMAAELPQALEDARPRSWGSADGSGEAISRSFADYYKRFIYDRDFAGARARRFNEFGKTSTTRPNIWEVYPNAIVVEAHVPGTKPESEGMDWASLLLVFEQHDSRWYLCALVHDQWTI